MGRGEARGTTHRRTLVRSVALTTFVLLSPPAAVPFQYSHDAPSTITIAPDSQYRAGWLHKLFFGSHWRDLWATTIEVDVLDLDDYAGGIRPVKRGGGFQTKSLRFRGSDGKEYKFRSITKDPTKVLPPELQESIAAGILQDQISSSNPVAPMIVAPLLEAVGVLNARPEIVYLPNTSKLGEYQAEFGGTLGTIEENPDEPEDGRPSGGQFAGADDFRSTLKLFDKLEEDDDERVDEAEYIKARLMDVFVGDWDRHTDQWRWAGYRESGTRRWVPIPRDRDQAFARFNGLFPWIASIAVPQLEGFGDGLPEIEDLTWSGRFVDRRLLSGSGRAVWDSVARDLQEKLTDSVIEGAVRLMPEPMFALEGEELIRALRARRTALPEAAGEFYELLAGYPDVRLTDKREFVEVAYLDGGLVDVAVYKRDKDSGGKRGVPRYRRVFRDDETHEIRLYLQGGDDLVRVTGERSASTGIVVVGGKGNDEVIDESTGGGLPEVPPFSLFSAPAVSVYDEDPAAPRETPGRIRFDATPAGKPATELERYEPKLRDYGYDWKFAPWYSVSPDEGLFIGGGPILYKHGFRVDPYVYRMQLRGGYATAPGRVRFDYTGDFRGVVPGRRLTLLVEYSQLDILNYFGEGNGTAPGDSLLDAGHYKARSRRFLLAPSLVFRPSGPTIVSVGPGLRGFDPDPSAGTILETVPPPGPSGNSWYGSLAVDAAYDTRDIPSAATGGVLSRLRFSAHHPFTRGFGSFQRLAAEFRAYLTPSGSPVTLALRGGAQKNWGRYPWYESVFLGGASGSLDARPGGPGAGGPGGAGASAVPLRGYDLQRFAGSAALHGAAEMRARLASFMFLVPLKFGVSLGAETGRVFAAGESSTRWHAAIGGGVWFSFLGPANVLGVSVVRSPERTGVYLSGGFAF